MRKYTLLAGSHVVGDRVFMPGDVVASDDDLVKEHKNKFSLLPEPEIVIVQVPAPIVEPGVSPVVEATEAVEAPEAPKAKKAK